MSLKRVHRLGCQPENEPLGMAGRRLRGPHGRPLPSPRRDDPGRAHRPRRNCVRQAHLRRSCTRWRSNVGWTRRKDERPYGFRAAEDQTRPWAIESCLQGQAAAIKQPDLRGIFVAKGTGEAVARFLETSGGPATMGMVKTSASAAAMARGGAVSLVSARQAVRILRGASPGGSDRRVGQPCRAPRA
jgi:hypothetical protein